AGGIDCRPPAWPGGLRPYGGGEDLRCPAADCAAPAELDLPGAVCGGWQHGDADGVAGPDVAVAELAGGRDRRRRASRGAGERGGSGGAGGGGRGGGGGGTPPGKGNPRGPPPLRP